LDAANTLETYVDDYLPRALCAVYRTSGSDDVTLFGYCLGGTLAAMLISAHDELPVANLVAVASPIDFQIASRVTPLFDPDLVHADDVLDDSGNVPPEFLWTAFTLLKPTRLAVTYANLWQNLWNDEWLAGYQAMAQWTRDHIPLPGAALRQLQDLTRRNALVTNEFALGGRPVRLSSITCPILNVIAEHDHVVPVDAATPLTGLAASREATDLRLPVGHMSLLTGRGATTSTMPPVVEWMRAHSCVYAARRRDRAPAAVAARVQPPRPG
jgi:polyhydroxyalkanoate synthase